MDYRPAVFGRGGIATYARDLAEALAASSGPEDSLALWAHRLRPPRFGAETPAGPVPPAGAETYAGRLPSLAVGVLARLGVGVDRLVGGVDVVHLTDYVTLPAAGRPVVATIHDVLFEEHPEWYTAAMRGGLRAVTTRLVRCAARLIVPSVRSRDALLAHYPADPGRIDVVEHGMRPLPAAAPALFPELPGGYVLSVGTLEPRKNLGRLLDAHARLQGTGRGFALVVVGSRGWLDDDVVRRVREQPGVRYEGRVGRARLGALYRGARALAYPSLGEGFGLPVLEAMAEGCPVIVARGTTCADLAGDAALEVDGEDVADLADALAKLLEDDVLRDDLARRGRDRARPYTWERAARATRHVYERALAG